MQNAAFTCCWIAFGLTTLSIASEAPKRVQPPQWSKDVLDAFFDDAREHLVGERPTNVARVRSEDATQAAPEAAAKGEFKWSQLIDADTLTAEIKRINNQLANSLRKSATFQGGGNLECRRDFGMLAVLFGVIAEFDGDVRWQQSAEWMQQRCLKTSRNCKVASAQTFADANETRALLEELLRGQDPTGESDNVADDQLAERTLLMQAMEVALKDQVGPTLTSARELRRRSQQASEQAQVLAVLAQVIQREGYEYSDDDDFLAEAGRLRRAAAELAQAAKDKNYETARAAAGRVGQSCSNCHEGYRG